jgi:hypothetical protein
MDRPINPHGKGDSEYVLRPISPKRYRGDLALALLFFDAKGLLNREFIVWVHHKSESIQIDTGRGRIDSDMGGGVRD